MKQLLITAIAAVVLVGVAQAEDSALRNKPSKESISINHLAWLTGSWQGPVNGGILEETWLPPKADTISALVRFTKDGSTKFIELIKIEKVGNSLELRLQIFDPPLHPRWEKPHVFELSKIEKNTITFRGISEGSHRKLSYERVSPDNYMIRFQTIEGRNVEINLSLPPKSIKEPRQLKN